MLNLLDIHHIAIICSDYRKSLQFYTEVLGFTLIGEHHRKERDSWKADLALESRYVIELFSFPNPPQRVSRPEAAGLRHLAFKVSNIFDAIRWLERNGVKTETVRVDEFTGKRFTFFLLIRIIYPWNSMSNNIIDIRNYVRDIATLFDETMLPWQITSEIQSWLFTKISRLTNAFIISDNVAIHKSAIIESGVILKGPVIIEEKCFVGAHAYFRGGVYLGKGTVVGPGCEIKSSIIMGSSALAHFNFIGDSIIGSDVNMEAGAVIANHYNERADKTIHVFVSGSNTAIPSKKFGALVGDGSRIGANAVLSPDTILKPGSIVNRLELVEQAH
jgi:UDP-N-acetylglucosamine diphosphorylase / glucose-1-phosphate thymidylyltransferase / UDP-N-acetylgalactosamine diphosphorylase / glucosamine-1-phosphate N-acetyltransferase / galactosamine-1-phosphate N-acetyltransferase